MSEFDTYIFHPNDDPTDRREFVAATIVAAWAMARIAWPDRELTCAGLKGNEATA